MGMFLIGEGAIAVGLMTVVMVIALLGVTGLGWYVIRCDIQNRHAERDLLLPEGHGSVDPHTTTIVHSAPAEAVAIEPVDAPSLTGTPTVPPRRRKGH